jgi:WD40 repeat protein
MTARMKNASIRALALAALLAVVLPAGAAAQFFGQNKVQYKRHDWRVLRTEHFDIHYYRDTEAAVHDAAVMAERAYQRLSRVLDHQIKARTPVVLYASNADFEQTNVVRELIGTGTGGLTEFVKRRVLLPFTGSYADLDHVLTHELVHSFEIDILFGERQGLLANPFSSTPPLWLMEGTAEYLSIGRVDNNTKMWLRDAALEGYLIPIGTLSYVGDIRVYRFGQSIMEFIADSYGLQKIGEIFKRVRRYGNIDAALESATGLTIDVLSKKWTESVRKAYLPDIADYDRPDAIADALTNNEADMAHFNVAPAVSPSGSQVVYISDRSMYNDIYLASALDGRVLKKLVSGERTGTVETLRYISTAMAWSPDETRIAYPGSAGGEDALYVEEVASGKVVYKLKFGLDAIYSPTFSPDGRRVAFVGLKNGLSHLCISNVDGRDFRMVLSGRYAVRDPAWSPDGGRIAYATDEGPDSDAERLIFGPLRLAIFDLATGAVTVVPGQKGKSLNPQWTPDGGALLYVSDRDGISNLYRTDLSTGQVTQLTHLLSGISGITPESPCISLSRDGRRLVFSTFSAGGWDLYSVRDPRRLYEGAGIQAAPLAAAEARAATVDQTPEPGQRVRPPGVDAAALPGPADSAAVADTTLAMIIDEVYSEPLVDSTTFVHMPYRTRFSRDYVTGGALYSSNVGFAGQAVLRFSDVLGNQTLTGVFGLYGDISNSDIYLAYENLSNRIGWGVAAFQFRNDQLVFSSPVADSVQSEVYRGCAFSFTRPFSRFRRLEFGIEAAALDQTLLEYNYALSSVSSARAGGTNYYVAPSIGLVADDALWGSTGPINGGRSRYTVEQSFGDVQYTTLVMDWRRYTNIAQRFSFAQRLIAGGSFGPHPRYFRAGGAFTYRGAEVGEGDLRGTHLLLGNLEFRFPLIDVLSLGLPGRIAFGGIRGVAFVDMASAWTDVPPQFVSTAGGTHTKDLRVAFGCGARVNLGYFILRYDFGQETNGQRYTSNGHHFVSFGADF